MTTDEEAKFNAMAATVNQLVDALNKLAAIQGLRWSMDCQDFVSAEKLDEFRKNPR